MTRPVPVVLAVGGSDPSGGAGIQADTLAIAAQGAHPAAVPAVLTVQDTRGVHAVHPLPARLVAEQLRHVLDDLRPEAVKLGMLGDAATVAAVADALEGQRPHLVIDPLTRSSSGADLLDREGRELLARRLLPRATVVTPNLDEVAWVEARAPAHVAVLVTGGHGSGEVVVDELRWRGTRHAFRHPRLATRSTHGTGCLLASALAAGLAWGLPLPEAAARAVSWLHERLARSAPLRLGHGPHHPVVPLPPGD